MMSWDLYSKRSGAGQGAGQGAELPDLLTALTHILVCILCHDVWFYYGHRLLHHPRIYKHIHKVIYQLELTRRHSCQVHHEWTAPIAPAATYAHPVEHILTGQMSVR